MTNELQAYTTSGLTLYAVLLSATGQAWNGSAFETVDSGSWTDYDIAMTEATAGLYLGDMPAVDAGIYGYVVYERAGATPATSDTIKGQGWLAWDGSAEIIPASNSTSTITVVASISGTTITITRGDTLSVSIAGLGSIANRTKLWFTVKRSTDEIDAASVLQVEETAGLIYANGATYGTAAHGTITVTSEAAGNITIGIDEAATAWLVPATGYVYDVQVLRSTGAVNTLTSGLLTVAADVTRAVA